MLKLIKAPLKMALKSCHLKIVSDNGPLTLAEIEEEFNTVYVAAQEKTQMTASDNILRRHRHHSLMQLLKNVLPDINTAHIAECGCFRGLSAYQIAYHARKRNFRNRFIIFDSFEGLSEFKDGDQSPATVAQKELLRKTFACPQDVVENNLKEFKFIEYKKGWIPERFSEASDLKFIFAHIDVDLYQPAKDSLEFFYPRMVSGGLIVFDDYGCLAFPGVKKAVDDFINGKKDFFLHLPSGEAFIIKEGVGNGQ